MKRESLLRRLERLEGVDPSEAGTVLVISSVPEEDMPGSDYRHWLEQSLAQLSGRIVYFMAVAPSP